MGKIITERTVFTDGDRFIIMYKNIDEVTKLKIMKALASVETELPAVSTAEEASVPVYPVEDPMPEIPEIPEELQTLQPQEPDVLSEQSSEPSEPVIQKGPYRGMTVDEILNTYGDKGYGNLAYLLAKSKDQQLKEAGKVAMAAYFKKRFSKGDPYINCAAWTKEDVDNFFSYFGTIVTDANKKTILEQAGAVDYDQFLNQASVETKKQLAAAIIKKYTKD